MLLGLQKLTLLDYPGVVACTLFSSGCNFACPFCHNASLAKGGAQEGFLSSDEVLEFLKKRSGLLDGVCLTGGEFLLHKESSELIANIKDLGYKVKLDTNGAFPEILEELLEEKKLDYVAMDIKNSPEKYALTSGNDKCLPLVEKSVKKLLEGKIPYEFRTTVTGSLHCREDFFAIGEWIRGAEKYFLQPFADSGDVLVNDPAYAVSNEQMAEYFAIVKEFVPASAIRGR